VNKITANYWWISGKGRFSLGTIKYVGVGVYVGKSNWQYDTVVTVMLPFVVIEVGLGGLKF
jgi:hypothetical protein